MPGRRRGARVDAKGRSDNARFIMLHHWILNCAAWRGLKPTARCLLLEVWQRYNGKNNGEISYSVREAATNLGISKDTASKYFHELEEKGFLKARKKGSFHYKARHATEWILTMERYQDAPMTKEFMTWQPEVKKEKRGPTD